MGRQNLYTRTPAPMGTIPSGHSIKLFMVCICIEESQRDYSNEL